MRALLGCVAILFALSVTPAPDAVAISKRKQCRDACAAKIDACVSAGTKKMKCRRVTLKTCRKKGVESCAVTTTTTTIRGASTTQVGATTTIGGSTTTGPAGTVTTTTGPGGTSSTTLACSLDDAVDQRSTANPTVSFSNYQYAPRCTRINAGQTVTFNGQFDTHPLVGGNLVGIVLMPDPMSPIGFTDSGTSKSVQFTSAGTYSFYCNQHAVDFAMTGAVFVDP
jgi:plastocyanin